MPSLRDFTNARVAIGRAGNSVPTNELLALRLAHARARDAVHLPLDSPSLMREYAAQGCQTLLLKSAVADRRQYLLRPDLGRTLSHSSEAELQQAKIQNPILYCVVDGLSSAAVHHHSAALLFELNAPSPILLVEQGRVAIGDHIGKITEAELVVLLVGERPGLSSPDSLGVYITYQPRPGRTDADRNCVSNIHDGGLSIPAAAQKIQYILQEARRRRLTGVNLKERANPLAPFVNTPNLSA